MGIRKPENAAADFLPGTLEMLILKTLSRGTNHGFAIAIGEGSLYPSLQRLLLDECVEAEWGVTDNNRKARFYRITAKGRKRLAEERQSFEYVLAGIARVMEA
jgi:DNA-binding PadR family transcriptional regulator